MIEALVARNTFREATRDRVLVGVISFGVAIFAATQLLSPLALGESNRLTIDMGLSTIALLGMLVILVVGTNLVAKEIERRTIYNLLSRPIPRSRYLVGKWAGLSAALWGVCGVLGLALWITLLIRGQVNYGPSLVQAIYLTGLELSVMTALAVLFSALSTPVLSALYTLGCFALGQWSYDLRAFAQHFPSGFRGAIEVAANVVPNLPVFNMRTLAAEGTAASPIHLGLATLYAVFYCACILSLASAAFESRDFK